MYEQTIKRTIRNDIAVPQLLSISVFVDHQRPSDTATCPMAEAGALSSTLPFFGTVLMLALLASFWFQPQGDLAN